MIATYIRMKLLRTNNTAMRGNTGRHGQRLLKIAAGRRRLHSMHIAAAGSSALRSHHYSAVRLCRQNRT